MTGRIEARLQELGIELPKSGEAAGNYVPFVRSGDLVFISGVLPVWNGERRFAGKLGREITIEQGQEAARLCGLNVFAHLRNALRGDLDRIVRCVRIGGFVNCTPDFASHPMVVNGCSDLMVQVLGEQGRHSRTAVGVSALPFDLAVEVESTFEVR
ncbi:MAG TPA: RidA family protein [Stellaceae bacterium]|nr:RidA family protein [Stellaceae bacterium]